MNPQFKGLTGPSPFASAINRRSLFSGCLNELDRDLPRESRNTPSSLFNLLKRIPTKPSDTSFLKQMVNISEIPYVVGLIEGEGCISSYMVKKRFPSTTIRIKMTDKEPLEHVTRILGFGEVKGPYSVKGGNKPVYRLDFCNFQHAQAVIGLCWKWLSPRRKEKCRQALNLQANGRSS